MNPTNYQTLRQRVEDACSGEALQRVEESATRVYNAGQLSVSEFRRVDVAIMEKGAKIGA